MKRKFALIVILLMCLTGCAGSITNLSTSYQASSQAVRDFAKISAQDWIFGSGIIQGALQQDALPAWVFAELQKVDQWFKSGTPELSDWQHGYIVGLRLRLAEPLIRAAIAQLPPALLNITEVAAVLGFLGVGAFGAI